MAWHKKPPQRRYVVKIIIIILFLYLGLVMLRSFRGSAIISRPDRINLGMYGNEAVLLSFGLEDGVNYIVSLSHEHKITIPGGYGEYRFGSLGKLVMLQKDSRIMQRAFSSMISAYTNYFIMPRNPDVYQKIDTENPEYSRVTIIKQLFSGKNISNMNVIDRVYIAFLVAKRRQQDYVVLRSSVRRDAKDGDRIFSEKSFQKKYKGFFYHQSFREEAKEVQIVYSNYTSAQTLSRIIEGQGIRVVDLAEIEEKNSHCILRIDKNSTKPLKSISTVRFLSREFNCIVIEDDTRGADIVIIPGEDVEVLWE